MHIDDIGALRRAWQLYPDRAGSNGSTERLLGIGEFARRSRLSLKALRLYDRLEVLRPAEVDPRTGYRRYQESQLAAARLLATLRRLDMPLPEVAELLGAPEETAAELLGRYWDAVERRVASQRELAAHVQRRLAGEPEAVALGHFGGIRHRQVPAQVVLVERRHILAPALALWLRSAMAQLAERAREYGGMSAPAFVVFHGEVSQDSDGPVEICIPVGPDAAGPALRPEPAHDEAYLRLRRAQVEYPQILSAFDLLAQWISEGEQDFAGPPREIYFADFAAAKADDEVCDVAFPVR